MIGPIPVPKTIAQLDPGRKLHDSHHISDLSVVDVPESNFLVERFCPVDIGHGDGYKFQPHVWHFGIACH